MIARLGLLAVLAVLALAGCSGDGRRVASYGTPAFRSYAAEGLASWYGDEMAGHPTASGERFAPDGITAAHRTLPLGSLVEVTDLATGRAILVRVNDRGPGRPDRLIDLSRGAAHLLGSDRHPVARVRLRSVAGDGHEGEIVARGRQAVDPPARPMRAGIDAGRYLVQVASFASEERARALADRLGADVARRGDLWRVTLGPYPTVEAQRARDAVARAGYADARLSATD